MVGRKFNEAKNAATRHSSRPEASPLESAVELAERVTTLSEVALRFTSGKMTSRR